jgi:asparagine synthase (glutamine-hydrolysing)
MCRISGFWDFNYNGSYDLTAVNTAMRDTLIHGGPDEAGLFEEKTHGMALAHRRLSIIDLSSLGRQPMTFENFIITYNGEIYNFAEVRKELEEAGYTFQSQSDTEVILKSFHHWGRECANKFRGMWAFAIWDKNKEELILCRDRMGVKPLYWYFHDGLFLFASELKAFHKHPRFKKELNPLGVDLFFQYSFIPAPHCIFNHAFKLEPATYLTISKTCEIKKYKYWDIDTFFAKGYQEKEKWLNRPEDEIASELEGILTEGFKLRMVADVPVGMFLSGGIDSSLVTALLQKEYSTPLKTFTIGFHEKKFNEANWAKKVANHLGTDHTELYCTPKDAFEVIAKLPEMYDEPFGDSSAIPTFLVSRLAREQVKVVLSADGGDEQFCGYPRYLNMEKLDRIPAPLRKTVSTLLQMVPPAAAASIYKTLKFALKDFKNFEDKYSKVRDVLKQKDSPARFDVTKSYFLKKDRKDLGLTAPERTAMPGNTYDVITKLMLVDLKSQLIDDMLTKVDRASMSLGLENREPLLDNKILEYSSQMPIDLKYKNGRTKYILRKILYKYVPSEFLERPKMGFEVPIHDWFKQDLKSIYTEYLNKDRIEKSNLFNASYVDALTKDYFDDKMVDAHKLWLLCTFEMWREKWMA